MYKMDCPPLLASLSAQPVKRRRLDTHAATTQQQYESPPSDASTASLVLPAYSDSVTPQSRKRSFAATLQQQQHQHTSQRQYITASRQKSILQRASLSTISPARLLPTLLPSLWNGVRHCLPHLNLQYHSTYALAGFLWNRLRDEVLVHRRVLFFTPAHGHTVSDSVLIGCLVVALKLEECRKGAPTVGRVATVFRTTAAVVSSLELQVLEACQWRPLAGWAASQQRMLTLR